MKYQQKPDYFYRRRLTYVSTRTTARPCSEWSTSLAKKNTSWISRTRLFLQYKKEEDLTNDNKLIINLAEILFIIVRKSYVVTRDASLPELT